MLNNITNDAKRPEIINGQIDIDIWFMFWDAAMYHTQEN